MIQMGGGHVTKNCRYVSDGDKQILRLCSATVVLLYPVAPSCTYLIYRSTRYGMICTNIVVCPLCGNAVNIVNTPCKLVFNPRNPQEHSATEYNVGQQGLTHDTRRLHH